MDARTTFAINGVTIDLGNESLRDSAGQSIALRAQSFAVLRQLLARAGSLVTKDELVAAVWPGIAVTDDSLVQCIHEIRRALNDDGHVHLKTVPKRGYLLLLPPEPAVAAVVEAAPVPRGKAGKWRIAIPLGGAAFAAAAALAWFLSADPTSTDGSRNRSHAIAVLPFDTIGNDQRQGYFADGITEDLITDLSRVPGIFVIARNSVWAYKDKSASPETVARELGVRYVLDGSVRREGDSVRINAQLIDALSSHHVWADRYDGAVGDVFGLQDKVIANIVSALAVKLPSSDAADTVETRNPEAYDALLLGLERLHLDKNEDTLIAISHFERAIELDPEYGRAYAALAAAQLRIVLSGWTTTDGAALDRAHLGLRRNLAKALERPTSLAYTVAAQWALQTSRNDDAAAFIDKAKALAPNDSEVLLSEASVLNATGQAESAEASLRLSMRLDPKFAPATLRALSVALFHQGKYWEAVEIIGRIKAQGAATADDYLTMVASLGQLGNNQGVDEAVERYNAVALSAGRDPISVQGAQWRWHGDLFAYHRPYVDKLVEGLRKAGVAEGAGTDVSFEQLRALIHRGPDGEFDVVGAPDLPALTAGGLFDRGVTFVDVRAGAGYASGHVPGAVNLSLVSDLSKDTLMKVAAPDKEIVFYCHRKYCEGAAIAAAKAVLWGYSRVYRLGGGVPAWKAADCPMEVASMK
jgi:TolB-like protein/DNA-binding winged helix-turn-helix (wHTH) protein/rhodanese-related sulfurtransferase/Flp pilus assembly protein TadD